MVEVEDRLAVFKRIGLDTSPFIYHFEANEVYTSFTIPLFRLIEEGTVKAVTTTVTLMEILVRPIAEGRMDVVEDYKYVLQNFPNLTLLDVDMEVAEKAAEIRAKYRVRPPDAIQLGAAILFDAEAFITNDRELSKVREIEVVIMDEVLGVNSSEI